MNIENQKQGHILITKINEHRFGARIAVDILNSITEFVNNGENSIVLNLSEVDSIDSRGLAAIVSIYKKVTQSGQMALSGTHKPVMDIFKLAGMDKVFRIYKSDEEAVAALSQ